MTAFLDVTRYIESLLRQAPALADGDIERSKLRLVAPTSVRALRIFPQQAEGQAAAVRGGWHSWSFDITVECLVRQPLSGANAGDVEAEADALLQAVWQRIAAAAPPAGVHSLLDRPRVSWEFLDADTPLGLAALSFGVQLSATNQTLESWS